MTIIKLTVFLDFESTGQIKWEP